MPSDECSTSNTDGTPTDQRREHWIGSSRSTATGERTGAFPNAQVRDERRALTSTCPAILTPHKCPFGDSVNSAFNSLRQLIPTEPINRKLSKIETLRLAKSYISHLLAVLVTGTNQRPCVEAHALQLPPEATPIGELVDEDDDDDPEERLERQIARGTSHGIGAYRKPICTFCVSFEKC
ncbi:basic helix-loop-helix transcription factor scleraxis-like [Anopheles darlingi]|uniref:basic helix-loop-helix transcription factor scleraxis-like n=1 Tax=Anopheles darlingi TaxID=43151 RepID=UPI0021000256|nr:basic helix-loop-helix transcription factor scleraxis-like [Anopheles darlingi]